ncbi:Ni/Fe-hydrogenase, b-type cytochrome subunit [Hydrogenovibrio marinus]|uniref:Ni/Fe hydrogenase 1 b-type cytochrome subunit n=1 Tax=Hydrogenovibrio marinus TaxID=28885 RepID=A0A066ZMN1_HYDMR|nr:Ni/Fe-hydrogenase, b-type cytochrome subunit [Hydrogenovibrio marinus]KDN94742.1 Ni/Fe hydrogenase 1 b-type cytochrome subunit [Hydrogenovibrio marinus]BBN59190.1 putative Ni/Fe-hydrogenase B-type cytochrome subunit [Hydrogenovibrio marinus]BBN59198.1 putative Ni/Fe-hydrogenase B-type cytochrome subunit [Hydrogenovibrio marinus]
MSDANLTGVDKVYVYEAPIRLWHWINMLAIIVLGITGYLIGNPLPTMSGEASDHYLMGTIRFLHFSAAYIFAIGFAGRIYWAFVGNHHARELFYVPIWRASWRKGFIDELKWYLFLKKEPGKHEGHNPMAQLAMFSMFVLGSILMIFTGFALYGEGTGPGSWANQLFGWVIPLFGQSQDVHSWHRLGLWIIVVFVIAHVYVAIREDIMSRQSMVSTMISGWRFFKDKR